MHVPFSSIKLKANGGLNEITRSKTNVLNNQLVKFQGRFHKIKQIHVLSFYFETYLKNLLSDYSMFSMLFLMMGLKPEIYMYIEIKTQNIYLFYFVKSTLKFY